jgi:hypothetical protein
VPVTPRVLTSTRAPRSRVPASTDVYPRVPASTHECPPQVFEILSKCCSQPRVAKTIVSVKPGNARKSPEKPRRSVAFCPPTPRGRNVRPRPVRVGRSFVCLCDCSFVCSFACLLACLLVSLFLCSFVRSLAFSLVALSVYWSGSKSIGACVRVCVSALVRPSSGRAHRVAPRAPARRRHVAAGRRRHRRRRYSTSAPGRRGLAPSTSAPGRRGLAPSTSAPGRHGLTPSTSAPGTRAAAAGLAALAELVTTTLAHLVAMESAAVVQVRTRVLEHSVYPPRAAWWQCSVIVASVL